MAVQRGIDRRKHDRPIEDRENLLARHQRLRVPQLEVAAVLLVPVFVQVDQHVEAAIEFQFRVYVEVGVHLQESARLDLMQPASAEVRIRNQSFDSGERFEKEEHLEPVHGVEETAHCVGNDAPFVVVAQLLLLGAVELSPLDCSRRWKLTQDCLEVGIVEETVEHDVRERTGAHVLRLEHLRVVIQSHDAIVEYAAVSDLPYRNFLYPLNVFMHILTREEGDVADLHYGLFERDGEPIAVAQERSTELLLAHLPPPPASLLEVGIGLGTTLARLTALGYDVEGITPDAQQIAVARARHDGIGIRESAFEAFHPGRVYDCVFFQESSQYIDSAVLFEKARELTGEVIVLDEFSTHPGASLHSLERFLACAAMNGFRKMEELDLSAKVRPTVDYFVARLPRHSDSLRRDLGLTAEHIRELIDGGQRYREMYRSGAYVYRLLTFQGDSLSPPRGERDPRSGG